jgi:hypothetical protein
MEEHVKTTSTVVKLADFLPETKCGILDLNPNAVYTFTFISNKVFPNILNAVHNIA